MKPEKYAKILEKLEFAEIFLESCSVDSKREEFFNAKEIMVGVNDRSKFIQKRGRLEVEHSYTLKLMRKDDETNLPFKISAKFRLVFISEVEISKEFYDIFKKINLPINSWPYFREFVQSMTQRMNIPPLTLPFVKRS